MRRVVTNGVVTDEPPSRRIWLWAGIAALASFLFGYFSAVAAVAQLFITDELRLGTIEQVAVVAVLPVGAVVGALGGGRLGDRVGPRRALLPAAALFLVGGLLAAVTPDLGILLAALLIQGLGAGLGAVTVPRYLSEIAPAERRRELLVLGQVMFLTGLVSAYVAHLLCAPDSAWRWMFGLGLAPGLLLLAGLAVVPESPVWLEGRGRLRAARRVLAREFGDSTADIHLFRLQQARRGVPQSIAPQRISAGTTRALLTVGVMLAVAGVLFTLHSPEACLITLGSLTGLVFAQYWMFGAGLIRERAKVRQVFRRYPR